MGLLKYSAFALLALRAIGGFAAEEEPMSSADIPQKLNVGVSTSFPDSEVFGVKLINGQSTHAVISFTNKEPAPVIVSLIGGALYSLQPLAPETHPSAAIVRNLTHTRYDVEVPAGETTELPYLFALDMNPQDLNLNLLSMVISEQGAMYQLSAYNATVSVVEAATSIFDPQIIFLYLFLLAAAGGTLFFVYKTWIEALFPQAKRSKGKRNVKKTIEEPGSPVPESASATGVAGKGYDESWIPEGHLNRPAAKRVKSGASTKAKRAE